MHVDLLVHYLLRCLPPIVVGVALLVLLPRRLAELRLAIYLLVFIVLRDVMTPVGFWRLGTEGWFWLRVLDDPALLSIVGVSSVAIVFIVQRVEPELAKHMVWRLRGWAQTIGAGLAGGLLVASPVALIHLSVPIEARGGAVAPWMWPVLLLFCLMVNLYEESIFRGYLQGILEREIGPLRAGVVSGLSFGLAHAFLATTVTDLGVPLLGFVVWEGVIAGLVRARWGVIGSTLTHGTGIFFIASGLI